jgi:hypothetical protein
MDSACKGPNAKSEHILFEELGPQLSTDPNLLHSFYG